MPQKNYVFAILITIFFTSCRLFTGLSSTTTITANNSFELGNNYHGKFQANVKNTSTQPVDVFLKPINGEAAKLKTLAPNESAIVKVAANTALVVKNNSNQSVDVSLKVKGDTGLSMGYKN
jgi:hypothetical protein